MKHKLSITLIMLGLFLVTQILGIFIISKGEAPEFINGEGQKNIAGFFSILISFIIAISFFFFLIKYKWKFFIKIWFSLVIFLALTITIYAILTIFFNEKTLILFYSLLISLFLTFLRVLRPSIIIHNFTEVLIYSGVSLIFIPFLSPFFVIILLVLISFYDIWAVWHVGFMQKIAKFQIDEVKIFNGFFVPYLNKDIMEKIKKVKKSKKLNAKLKVPIALLGGGDVAFTLIPAGVFLKSFGLMAAIFVVLGGFFGLCYLMFFSEKKKFYPAMPFITLGIFISLFFYFFIFKIFY